MTIAYEKLLKLSQLQYFKGKQDAFNAETYATITDLETLEGTVEGLVTTGGEPNVLEGITVNGDAVSLSNKVAALTIPTNNNQLTNGAGYQTASDVATAVEAYGYQTASDVSTAIAGKADSADLGTAAAADTESAVANDSALPTGAAVITYVTGLGYQTSSDVATAISGKADSADLGTAAAATVETTGVSSNTTTLPTTAQVKSYVEGLGYQTASDVSTAIGSAIATAMDYKGVVADMTALNAVSSPKTGDVYHVTSDGSEYAWNGSAWEELGVTFDATGFIQSSDISVATDSDIDAMFAPASAGE